MARFRWAVVALEIIIHSNASVICPIISRPLGLQKRVLASLLGWSSHSCKGISLKSVTHIVSGMQEVAIVPTECAVQQD